MKAGCFDFEDFKANQQVARVEDWLGKNGTPVALIIADARASICASCRGNRILNWGVVLEPTSRIRMEDFFRLKTSMGLATHFDSELGICIACKCSLAHKVWCQLQQIQDTIQYAVRMKMLFTNDKCWVVQELFKHTQQQRLALVTHA